MDQAIISCLEGLASKHPEHEERLEKMKEQYRKRMWFLLTDQLLEYVSLPVFKAKGNSDLLPFFDSIIKPLGTRVSQLKFVMLVSRCAAQLPGTPRALTLSEGRLGVSRKGGGRSQGRRGENSAQRL